MDLKVYRYFLTVANTKNITKAAELLHITQPTLSRQLILLEENLGVNLFNKSNRVIELTDEGRLLKKRAREILDLDELTRREIVDANSIISGVVSIGYIESIGTQELYHQMKCFKEIYPNVSFNLHTGNSDDMLEKMAHGIIDLCLLLDPVDTSEYNVIRLSYNEVWGVLVNKSDELAQKDQLSIKDLISLPLIFPSRLAARNEIENWFGKNKYQLNIFGTYNLVSSAIQCVESGLGYPFCLNNSLIDNHNNVCFRPIKPIKATQSVILWNKNRNFNSATELFVKQLFHYFNPEIYK